MGRRRVRRVRVARRSRRRSTRLRSMLRSVHSIPLTISICVMCDAARREVRVPRRPEETPQIHDPALIRDRIVIPALIAVSESTLARGPAHRLDARRLFRIQFRVFCVCFCSQDPPSLPCPGLLSVCVSSHTQCAKPLRKVYICILAVSLSARAQAAT